MTVPTTYPGVYIQELPSLSHTITPASTSVAAFVGYTHPLKTGLHWTAPLSQQCANSAATAPAIPLFSFADYQANFGGFFDSLWVPDYVGRAVFQFFQNGGSSAYVVGLTDPNYPPATAQIQSSPSPITVTALEPVGTVSGSPLTAIGIAMQVTISNVSPTGDTADIVITYGTQVETYRKVPITNLSTLPPVPATPSQQAQPAGALYGSALVSIPTPSPATSYPSASPLGSQTVLTFDYPSTLPASYSLTNPQSIISPRVIGEVFTDNYPLDKVLPTFNVLVIPGVTDPTVLAEGVAYAERKRAFYIMDSPPNWEVDAPPTENSPNSPVDDLGLLPVPVSTNAAIYYPWLQTTDPVTNSTTNPVTNQPSTSPPSGFVAGIYAAEDATRGVWKSPAGLETALTGALRVVPTGVMTDAQQGVLNQLGINCLRQFPSLPPVVYGARTLAYRDQALQAQWGYIAVRRMALFLEQTLYTQLSWAVFQPNDTPLWNALTQAVSAFMLGLFRQGAFAGTKPSDAFLVKCDNTTTTTTDIDNGIVNILVGFAPLKPAEFVIVQIAQLAGQATS